MTVNVPAGSRFGAIFIVLFGLFFAGMGLFVMAGRLSQGDSGGGKPLWFGLLFSSVFVMVGLAAMVGGIIAWRQAVRRAALERSYPDQPWMWQQDWAGGRIRDGNFKTVLVVGGIALFWNLVAWSVTIGIFIDGDHLENKAAYITLFFPLVGIGLVFALVYQIRRWQKYGTSVFEMVEVPGVIGGNLGGVVMTRVNIKPAEGFRLVLRSVHQWTSGSGKNRTTHTETLWESEQRMQQEAMADDPTRSALPVLFFIPYDCKPTERLSPGSENYWELEVSAATPGIDYKASFRVPVFKTRDSDPDATHDESAITAGGVTTTGLPPLSSIRGLSISPSLTGGEQLEFKAGRHKIFLIVPLLIGIGLCVGTYFLWTKSDAPKIFPVFMAVFGLLITAGVVSSMLTYVRIILHDDRIEVDSRMFGFGKRKVLSRDQITKINTMQGMSSGNTVFYNIVIDTADGNKERIPTLIKGRREADALVAHLQGN